MILIQQEEIKALQKNDEKLYEQMVILSNRLRFLNLKLRGLTKGVEESAELTTYISQWLVKLMNLESLAVPIISQAYCLSRRINPSRLLPWDAIVTLTDVRFKKNI